MEGAKTPETEPTTPGQPGQEDTVPEPATDSAPASNQGEAQNTTGGKKFPEGQPSEGKGPQKRSKRTGYRWSK